MVDDLSAAGAGGASGPPSAPTQPVPPQHAPGPPAGGYAHPGAPPTEAAGSPAGQAPPPGYTPPPGYAPPPGYGPPPGFTQPEPTGGGVKVGGAVLWSLISVAAIALAVSLEEDGQNGWENIGVWAGFAIAAAVATLAPAVRSNVNIDATRAWQIAVAGAVGLAAFWVLFILPVIERNVSFLATLGVVAGGLAAWLAPGRPEAGPGTGQSW